jgi:hypothetical protein
MITAAQQVPDVQVESIRPFAGTLSTLRELELLEELADAPQGTTAKLLAAGLPRAFHSGWAVLLAGSAADRCAVLAASDAAPSFEGVVLPWMPLAAPRLLPSEEDWLPERWRAMAIEMMAVPFAPTPEEETGKAIVLGRSGGPAFRRSELLRLVHLAGIAAAVASLPAG